MDNKVIVDEAKFKELKDKVVVLTGKRTTRIKIILTQQRLRKQAEQMASVPPQSDTSSKPAHT